MISHQNIIANILQTTVFEGVPRKQQNVDVQTMIGVLPFSHIYALTLVAHLSQYRGDQVVVLPRFELKSFLRSIEQYHIEQLSIVPPILIQMITHQDECNKYDLSSIRYVFSGAAPLGVEVMDDIRKLYPKWLLGQGYGEHSALPILQGIF
jgi:acyl-CoA synthetase (AMP-forming)/AMP-acid ligase II